jgi:peptide/nickel transport system permease protein
MAAYIIRRLLYTIPIVFGVILLLFVIFNWVGGNPVRAMLGKNATPKMIRDIEHQMGLDLPLIANIDAITASGSRAEALQHLSALEATGPAPEKYLPRAEHNDALNALYDEFRFSVPALVQTVLDESAPLERRRWADFALQHVTGEKFFWRSSVAKTRERAQRRWTTWWEKRGDRPAFSPAWGNFFQSQLFHFLWQALTFDFGRSMQRGQTIGEMVVAGAPASLAVTVPGFLLAEILSIGLALICAYWRGGYIDRSVVVLTVLGMSITMLAYIIAGQYVFSHMIPIFPIQGFKSPFVPYVLLPVCLFVLVSLGPNVRFFRTVMLDEVSQDYVRTARAKGVSNRSVMLKHVLKNAMIPIITYTVIAIPFLFMGSLLLERFFSIPGLGGTMVDAIFEADWPVVRAFTYLLALLYVFGNLLTDICYALVDPRISLK